jgi:hypothetical protein
MIPILSLLVVLAISLVVTRLASLALTLTGLSRETARFQARAYDDRFSNPLGRTWTLGARYEFL